jgi:hypothetical protein
MVQSKFPLFYQRTYISPLRKEAAWRWKRLDIAISLPTKCHKLRKEGGDYARCKTTSTIAGFTESARHILEAAEPITGGIDSGV